MKTNIDNGGKIARQDGYRHESLSVKEAIVWFIITVAALCIAGTSQAGTHEEDSVSVPVKKNN